MSADDPSEMLYDGLPELIDMDNEDLPPPRRSQRLYQVQYPPMDLDHGENENDEEEEKEYTPLSPKHYQRSDPVPSSSMDVDVIEEDTIEPEANSAEEAITLSSHPLVNREAFGPGKTYITIRDTFKAAMRHLCNFEKGLKILLGLDVKMEPQGLIELQNGDVIIIRDPTMNEDYLGVFVCNYESVLPDDPLVLEIMSLNQQILGPPHLCTPDAPHKVRKEFIGGTHFECSGAEPVMPNTRCYTLGPTHQHSRNLTSPTSARKVESDGTISDDVKLR
ncbi:hypothetical protein H0H93_005528 [Arthromyces matolae]|nr:hypothetical protein H0H93_005528 [Arthromyces matolae]